MRAKLVPEDVLLRVSTWFRRMLHKLIGVVVHDEHHERTGRTVAHAQAVYPSTGSGELHDVHVRDWESSSRPFPCVFGDWQHRHERDHSMYVY